MAIRRDSVYLSYDRHNVQWRSDDGWNWTSQQTGLTLTWEVYKSTQGPLDENCLDTLLERQSAAPTGFYALDDPPGW